jgi:hypothetical protein
MSTIRDPHAISRFQQEALTASSLNHPHILTVFENLIATSRFSRVSRARYTSPSPRSPRRATISYGPIWRPADSGIGVRTGGANYIPG